MILLDSDAVIKTGKQNPELKELLFSMGSPALAVTIVTRAEVLRGAVNKEHLQSLRKALRAFHLVDVNEIASRLFTSLFEQYVLSHGGPSPIR